MQNNLRVSIITPSYNQGGFIEKTVLSILTQDYSELEYIVVDGCSTDNTLDVIKKYSDEIKWVSEPDEGQADAINKGSKMAKGEILGWINSDDTYNAGTLRMVADFFSKNPDIVMVYGDAYFIDGVGKIIGRYPTEQFNLKGLADTCYICQPTVFMRVDVYHEIGMLDSQLHTCFDYDYWIRIGKHYPAHKITYLKGAYLANSRMHDENKTIRMRKEVYKEAMKTQKKYFGKFSKRWIHGYAKEIIIGMRFKIEK